MKLNIAKTFTISLAFFTISLAWTIYNTFVPVFLIGNEQISGLIKSSTVLGVIMTLDNLFGLIFQPYFGSLSDKTKTRFGRRMPFIIVGIPLSALFFSIIPFYNEIGSLFQFDIRLMILMVSVIGMNFFMSVYRAPATALMPDATPAGLRSRANGIITAMGGLGTIIAFSLGGKLFNIDYKLPFIIGGAIMIFALVVLFIFHKEPEEPYSADDEEVTEKVDTGFLFGKNGQQPAITRTPSLLHMLLTVFFWYCGFECINAFFTLYCQEKFNILPGDATQMLAPMAVIFMICAFPAGFVGGKIGRKKSMLIGNAVVISSFLIIFMLKEQTFLSVLLGISGMGWSLLTTNAYPAVAEMAPKGHTGQYTGYYYVFTFAASIISPILYGLTVDILRSQAYLFVFGGTMFILGMVFLIKVKRRDVYHQIGQKAQN
ncbi:MAG: SLC45 family MFS transporter [Clostridiaceae bacterium]|nr:SLC45 family MFS transporter [Clostridiaceae bacterium]